MAPKRGKCKFNLNLKKLYPMFKSTSEDDSEVFCPICNVKFNIANKGKFDLDQHLSSSKHKLSIQSASSSTKVTEFFTKKFTKEEEYVSASEGAFAFHTVKHHHSFRSCDCSTKLYKKTFFDSSIAKKMACARTKTEAIVVNVLSPHTISTTVKEADGCMFFGISSDASNHGSLKLFPVLIQYFHHQKGLNVKLIDLHALDNEKAEDIAHYLLGVATKYGIANKCVAFSGDNCNTNFGGVNRAGRNNVFCHLKSLVNPQLVGVGCPAHILHNTIQYGMNSLPLDVESVILKIYNYFSIYTVRTKELKSFCDFVEIEYRQLLKHSKTRWLSLYPCLQRILEMYEPLCSYFKSQQNVPILIKQLFENPLNESYIWFLHSIMYCFNNQIKKMEREANSVLEVIEIFDDLEYILRERLAEEFLPLKVKQILSNPTEDGKAAFIIEKNLLNIYEKSIEYLTTWRAPFLEFKDLSWMALKKIPNWKEVQSSLQFFLTKNVKIDENKCFNQYCNLNRFLTTKVDEAEFSKLLAPDKWMSYFKSLPEEEELYSELKLMCAFFFAIPANNAAVERVFSLINNQWTDERNRLEVESVKGIVSVQFNNREMACGDYYDYLLENKIVLKQISSSEKY